ncbi:MAG: O-antigen ligase family protein [Oscillospiraceae bacterium]|nr:O-antigen ligase family protein [Oscillospiraceae bacterium]
MSFGKKLTSEKFYALYISTLMILIPLGEFISEFFDVQFYAQQVIVAVYGAVGIVSVMFFFFEKSKAPQFYPSDISYVSLLLFAVISLIFTQNILSGTGGGGEWLIHFAAYFSLMFAGTMIKSAELRKKVICVFVAAAIFNCLVAFPQSFGLRIMDCTTAPEYHTIMNAVFGLTHNCNYFAGLCTLFIGLSSGLFIFSEKTSAKWLSLALYALCFYCAIATTTRIAWLGSLGVLFFYAVSFIVMKAKKYDVGKLKSHWARLGIITAVSAAIFIYFAIFTDAMYFSLIETATDITMSESENVSFEEFGSKRGYIWKYAFKALPKHWLTGVGLDNFYYVFTSNPEWDHTHSAPRAHNEYIQTLVTQGVFAAVNYIAMLVYACVTGVRTVISTKDNEKRIITWILLGMFAGYAVQALVNSSVVNVAPYFWITVGMTMPKSEQKVIRLKNRKT